MRARRLTWILVGSVFVGVAILLLWITNRREGQDAGLNAVQSAPPPVHALLSKPAPGRSWQTVKTESTSPMALMAQPQTGGPARETTLQYRLSNTSRSVGQLLRNDHAILLENALVDTERPVSLAIPEHLRAQGDPGSYIVQARQPLDNAFRKLLADAGATIVSYIPNNAYLVRASAAGAQQVAADGQTQTVLPYEPYYKLKGSLLRLAVEQEPLPADSGLNLGLFKDAAPATIKEIEKLGGQILGEDRSPSGPVVRVRPPLDHWTELAALPGVHLVEWYYPRTVANDLTRVRIGVSEDTLTPTNYLGLTGSNILVALGDSGVDQSHPDLTGRVILGPGADGFDLNGHGTHVAGIIAGNGSNSINPVNVGATASGSVSNADFRGKAPLANLYVLPVNVGTKPMVSAGAPAVSDAFLQEAAAQTNAFISNNSWNYGGDNSYGLAAASYDAAVRDALPGVPGSQPVLFVFSAGNAGNGNDSGLSGDSDSIRSPGTAKNVITVGAIEQPRNITNEVTAADGSTNKPWAGMTDSANQVAAFSSRGNVGIGIEGDYGRYKPDLVAPGTFVISTRSGNWDTNAYYNPTNHHYNTLFDQFTKTNSLNYGSVYLPGNTVRLTVDLLSYRRSPVPFPDMPIFVWQGTYPTEAPYDFVRTNHVSAPPDGGDPLAPVPAEWWYAIGNVTTQTVYYHILTDIITTNDLGNYYTVLSNLNNSLGSTNGPWYYRYESGTSMSAADASGTLALMQEFFQTHGLTNSPALMKALLINGARSVNPLYNFQVRNTFNYQGWGLIKLPNSLPPAVTNVAAGQLPQPSSIWFVDQSPTNALATGQSKTRTVTFDNTNAPSVRLRITLVWTDPPGDPAAGVKLVNDMDLVVTNLDTSEVYFGNDIPVGSIFNLPWDTNAPPNVDSVNNVENVYLDAPLATNGYSVTVAARRVNVNAVSANTNNVVQDYALVLSSGDGELQDALTVKEDLAVSSDAINLTQVTNTFNNGEFAGAILLEQHVGANFQLLGTNTIPLGTKTIWGTNGAITLGVANQWHFYVITNTEAGFTNAAFVTFLPPDLALPRMGVREADLDNAARAEADIDLYVSRDATLLDLDPTVVNAADKSLGRGGTEIITYTDSQQGAVYYIGVKSEDQMAAEYGFLGVFSSVPFSESTSNGVYVRGFPLPVVVPDGNNADPGVGLVFGLDLHQLTVRRVIVTNSISHDNLGDLVGNLSHGGKYAVLNNHRNADSPPPGPYSFIYEDNGESLIPPGGFRLLQSDGPGGLREFVGEEGLGLWLLAMLDDHQTQTGSVQILSLLLQPQNLTNGEPITLEPNTWAYDSIDVPPEATNLTVSISFEGSSTGPVDLFVRRGEFPTQTEFDRSLIGIFAPGGSISIGPADSPPLNAGRYYIGVYNSSGEQQTIRISVTLGLNLAGIVPDVFAVTNRMLVLDNAITNSSIFITNDQRIVRVEVAVQIDHPRVSDLALTLISPQGKRIVLSEDRGAGTADGMGGGLVITNVYPQTTNGNWEANTNLIDTGQNQGTLLVDYDFYTIPDALSVYYDGALIFNSGLVSGAGQFRVNFGPGTSTDLLIVMNEGNNADTNTLWTYTASVTWRTPGYLVFTENTNKTMVPIKFATPPFTPPIMAPGLGYVQWPGSAGGNGHWYKAVVNSSINPLNWVQVDQIAHNEGGYLATITSVAENNFVFGLVNSPQFFMGRGLNGSGPALGGFQPPGSPEPAGGWSWETGEPWNYTNWLPGQPDNINNVENRLQYWSGTQGVPAPTWNDLATNDLNLGGYVIEHDPVVSDLDYHPEETLDVLKGESAKGKWQLEVWDTRTGLLFTNPELVSWQLRFIFERVVPPAIELTHGVTVTNIVDTNQIQYFFVEVPVWARAATNTLVTASAPVNLWFNQTGVPTGTNGPGDVLLLSDVTSGVATLTSNSVPPLISGRRYYLGVQNTNAVPVTFSIRVEFDVTTLSEGVPVASVADTTYWGRMFQYDVSSNATAVAFALTNLSGDVDLVARYGLPLPTLSSYDYGRFAPGTNDELIVVFTNSTPVPLAPGRWYLGVFNADITNVDYTIVAVEFTNTLPTIITLTNAMPYFNVNAGGSSPIDYYRYVVSRSAVRAQFEINGPSDNLALVVRKGFPPLPDLATYDYLSDNPGANDELIVLLDSLTPVPLTSGEWYLSAVNEAGIPVSYAIMATEWSASQYSTNFGILRYTISPDSFCITWSSVPGVHYVVEGTPSLPPPYWTNVSPTITATSTETTWCVPLPSPYHFFRVREGLALSPYVPQINFSSINVTPGGVVLNWSAATNLQFQVQWTPSLTPPVWNTIPTIITSATGLFTFTDDGSQTGGLGGTRFYRLLVLP